MILIANHHDQADCHAESISQRLSIRPDLLEQAFQTCRGCSCHGAIQAYRLSRLFDRITAMPATPLASQVNGCGFRSVAEADQLFRSDFGIDLESFHAVSHKAAADRHFRQRHPEDHHLIINEYEATRAAPQPVSDRGSMMAQEPDRAGGSRNPASHNAQA